MISVSTIAILVALDLLGLGAIWLYVKSRLRKALEFDSLLFDLRKEVGILTTELNQTTDRNISLVEDRMEALRSLLDEADRRMGVIRKEVETKAVEREVYSRLGRPHPAPALAYQAPSGQPPLPGLEAAPPYAEPARHREGPGEPGPAASRTGRSAASRDLPGAGTQAADIGRPAYRTAGDPGQGEYLPAEAQEGRGSLPGSVRTAEGPIRLDLPRRPVEVIQARESVIPPKSLREQALELYSQGFSADIIAARLGTTVAEMDLLISLEEEKRQSEGR